ncbi:MAG: response regulator [Rhodospirillales bacterium]|nr:response regulator [Rhodospirillales bacterium]
MTNEEKSIRAPYILIVEDSPVDFEIAMRSLRKADVDVTVERCEDGDEAIAFLTSDNPIIKERGFPELILLDLNLPGTDGRAVLEHVKNAESLKSIPVIILSTSNNERDITACYRNGANSYVKKPIAPDDYTAMAQSLKSFWFDWVMLPQEFS